MATTRHSLETLNARIRLPSLGTFVNRCWWWTTLLVLVGIVVLIRLGFWQLDRLAQRRAYNAEVIAKLALPPLVLNDQELPANLGELRFRQAKGQGEYDLTQQMALTQQNWMNTPGFHLITPLVLQDGSQSQSGRPTAVLVDRGWLPAAELDRENWSKYDVKGPVAVTGYVKLSQTVKGSTGVANSSSGTPQNEWYRVDVDAIEAQLPYDLLPIYLQEVPPAEGSELLPFRGVLEPDLSDGPHLSYALQWFIFATILALGYVFFVGSRSEEAAGDGQ
jgi:surfeit locus 1 family protein